MRHYIVLLMLLPAVTAAARDLTLDQALRLAEEHSHQLKEARANLEASNAAVGAAKAERFPTLSIDAVANYIDDVPSLDINLPTGGTLSRDFGSNETYQADLRLSLPLYTGGRLSSAIQIAESEHAYRRARADLSLDQIQLRTRLHYFGLQKALELQRAARASRDRTGILLEDTRNGLAAGVADSVDLLEVRLAHTRADFAVRRTEIAVRTEEIKLLVDLGLSPTDSLRLIDTLPEPTDLGALTTVGGSRPELAASLAMIDLQAARVKAATADYFPTLGLYSGYAYGKPNNDPFANEWKDNITVGARLQWSFNLGRKTASRKKAVGFELEAARRSQDELGEAIDREIELAREQLRLAFERYRSAQSEFRVSSDNFRLASNRHEAGVLSSNRLVEIEAALTAAEANMAAARVDYYIARSHYLYATGDDKLGEGI